MARIPQAEQVLLDGIRRGDDRAWSRLVDRFQGRLLAFARARVPHEVECEDLVQETFVSFIKGLPQFREDCNLETYLFCLLRKKIVDSYRRREARHVCLLQDRADPDGQDGPADPLEQRPCTDPSVSWVARQNEQRDLHRRALVSAVSGLVEGFKRDLDFTALQSIELLFYCQSPNHQVASLLGLTPNQVGVFKHRCLREVRRAVSGSGPVGNEQDEAVELEGLLTEVWRSERLSCPKRSTIGRYVLGTLEPAWHAYVDFHLNTLGCHF